MARSTATDSEVPAALLADLGAWVRATVRAEVKAAQGEEDGGDPWVTISQYLSISPRAAYEHAKSGRIEGARKLDSRWRARRSACDRFMEQHGTPPASAANDSTDEGASLLNELGLEQAARKPRAR